VVHQSCLDSVVLLCPSPVNFSPDRIRAAFLRTLTTLLVGYRKFLEPVSRNTARPPSEGKLYNFKLLGWLKSAPRDSVPYLEMLSETQAFSEFIMERCDRPPDDPEIAYFDQMIAAKRNRGRHGMLWGKQGTNKSPHLLSYGLEMLTWGVGTPMLFPVPVTLETRKAIPPNDSRLPPNWDLPDQPPAKLDPRILTPPRLAQQRNKFSMARGFARRKPVNKRSDDTIISPPPPQT
jgi:dDENN domain